RCYSVTEEDNAIVATAPEASHAFRNTKRGLGKSSHKFTFSRIFNEDTSQGDFFNATMLSMTKDFISGQNSLVFTYGVTSSGKTYTIQGQPQNAGILPRCLDVIFNSINGKQIPSSTTLKPRMFTDIVRLSPSEVLLERKLKERTLKMSVDDDTTVMTLLGDEMESALSDTATSSSSACGEDLLPDVENRDREELKVDVEDQGKIRFGVWVSFAEIYNEQIFDLLEPFPRKKNAKRPPLKICDDRNGNPYIKGLKEIHVESADEAYRLLTIGQRNLQTACTRLNHCSSRSHCMFNIKIVRVVDKDDPHIARVSMLSLCDLAGSERYSKTQATGDRLKEAGNINSSLMTLGRCIETLRYNQLHRDQQRLVPFRDSKLTRMLQNYFNGSGRAAMIVNVSQSASMFDDTLHVFKFSAIAKQVKYIEKPPEPPKKQKEKKVLPPVQRPSIEWEVHDAQNKPLPDDEEYEEEEDSEDNQDENISDKCQIQKLRACIQSLQQRNERLVEMLQEELEASSNLESRVRQEVTQAMMKQVVNIEETYSALLKETNEDAQEIADERVKGIMEVYEQRIERIQKKIDEDDEWVSSLLYCQEQMKVQERDAEIAELNSQLEKLREEHAISQKKDEKIEELESLIAEAGEVYNKHTAEISQLTEEKAKIESQLSALKDVEIQLEEIMSNNNSLQQSLKNKEAEWKALEGKLIKKIENKDATITSLQDECKELQDEIERLQDQMSQMDEHSKYRFELETSAGSDHKENRHSIGSSSKHADRPTEPAPEMSNKTVKENTSQHTEENSVTGDSFADILKELTHLREEAAKKDKETEEIKQVNEELKKQIKCLQSKVDDLVMEVDVKENDKYKYTEEIKALQATSEQLRGDVDSAKESKMSTEEKLTVLHEENNQIRSELESLKKVNEELVEKVQLLQKEQKQISGEKLFACLSGDRISASELSKHSEQGTSACSEKGNSQMLDEKGNSQMLDEKTIDQSNDDEIVFNVKMDNTTYETLKNEHDKLRQEYDDLQIAHASLKERVQNLDDQLSKKDTEENKDSDDKEINITEMVRHIEQKTPLPKHSLSGKCLLKDTDHSSVLEVTGKKEISALKLKAEIDEEILKTPCTRSSHNSGTVTLAVRLKDAELANAALRNKLKKEEEDFFKREQALIHGYTAEIENLKYELAKLKSKVDVSGRLLPQRGKRKATDSSMTSSLSDSISETNPADLNLINAKGDDIVKEKQSAIVLSNELLSVQEQLLSLAAEYRRLQATENKNSTNSFITDVVLGTPRGRQSAQGIFRFEENVADSVLQFELDEFAVRMDEMRIKISQQEKEITLSKAALKKVNAEKLEMESKFKEMLQNQGSQRTDELIKLEGTVETELSSKKMIEEKLQEADAAKSQLQSEVANQKVMITEMKETLETAIVAKSEAELKLIDLSKKLTMRNEEFEKSEVKLKNLQKIIENLNREQDNLIQTIRSLKENQYMQDHNVEEVDQELKEAQNLVKKMANELEVLKEDLKTQEKHHEEAEAKLAEALTEKALLEESLKNKSKELDDCREKLSYLEQKYNDVQETLATTASLKDNCERKLKYADEKLAALEELMNKQQEEHTSKVNALKQQLSGEGEAKMEALTRLEKHVDELKLQLKVKTAELEKIECQRQEEGAEVSQKLLMLEREKKLAERRAADAKEREMEWQLKYQGMDQMKQLEQQLHQQLKSAAECLRKLSVKTSQLSSDLAIKEQELEQLREELARMESHTKVEHLEKSLASEKEQRCQVQKSLQESQEHFAILKSTFADCEETMDRQETIIDKQDVDLSSFKTKIETLTAETERLGQLLISKELEVASLNKKMTKLEAEVTVLHQSEQKASDVENICHDKLQKYQSERRELEDRLQNIEEENRSLEKKLNISEKHLNQEKENVEDLEERLSKSEKQKKDLEREIQSLTDKQKIVEEQMEQVNRQRAEELEQSCTLKAELKLLRKEVSQQKELDKLNDTLKETAEKLKVSNIYLQNFLAAEEKELKKQERINKRNREEMENWKQERDACVSRIEQHLNMRQQECQDLVKEVEQLKKDNADLVKTVANITSMKDSVIADLRKQNNILSTQMAHAQGMSSPPKIATPDNSVFSRNEFVEDLDTTGHLEIDATPPIAAKKCRKRQSRQTQLSCSGSSVDSEVPTTPACKSLKPIEEQNENSPGIARMTSPTKSITRTTSPTKINLHERVVGLASEVIASISPLTRSAKKREKDVKRSKTLTTAAPFDLAPYSAADDVQNENANPFGTRKSSRLRTRSKHTAI
ncbi:unnamed protein product, partial [Candidula unifasciata]